MDRLIKELEEVRQHFQQTSSPTAKQSTVLRKNLHLLREGSATWESLSKSARYRRKTGQKVLRTIFNDLGRNAFCFAASSLSLSGMLEVDNFIPAYRQWWDKVAIPDAFTTHVATLDGDISILLELRKYLISSFHCL